MHNKKNERKTKENDWNPNDVGGELEKNALDEHIYWSRVRMMTRWIVAIQVHFCTVTNEQGNAVADLFQAWLHVTGFKWSRDAMVPLHQVRSGAENTLRI